MSYFNDGHFHKLIVDSTCNPTFEGAQTASKSLMHIVAYSKSMITENASNIVKGYFKFIVVLHTEGVYTAPATSYYNVLRGLIVNNVCPMLGFESAQTPSHYVHNSKISLVFEEDSKILCEGNWSSTTTKMFGNFIYLNFTYLIDTFDIKDFGHIKLIKLITALGHNKLIKLIKVFGHIEIIQIITSFGNNKLTEHNNINQAQLIVVTTSQLIVVTAYEFIVATACFQLIVVTASVNAKTKIPFTAFDQQIIFKGGHTSMVSMEQLASLASLLTSVASACRPQLPC